MVSWSFLTSHARVLLCIARDPGVRLRDIAASLGITERSAHAILADLAGAGYVVICFRWISSPPTMGIGTSSSSGGRTHAPPANCLRGQS